MIPSYRLTYVAPSLSRWFEKCQTGDILAFPGDVATRTKLSTATGKSFSWQQSIEELTEVSNDQEIVVNAAGDDDLEDGVDLDVI